MGKQNKIVNWGIGVLVVGALLYLFLPGGPGENFFEEKHKFQCTVDLSNPILKDVTIKDVQCENMGLCTLSCGTTYGLLDPFSIVKDDGKVVLLTDNMRDVKSYKITELTSKKYGLCVCSSSNTGEIQVLNKNNAVIDSRSVVV